MKKFDFLVVGDKPAVMLFSLLGARTMAAENMADFALALSYIELNISEIGGICLSGTFMLKAKKEIEKLKKLNVPVIFLPSLGSDEEDGYRALEDMMQKAIGIKLSSGNTAAIVDQTTSK